MKSPIVKLAIATVVIIACVIGLFFWRSTGSGIALADVFAQMEKASAYRYQWNVKMTSEDPKKPFSSERRGTILESQVYGGKGKIEQLDPNGGWSTVTEGHRFPRKQTMIMVMPKEKQYWRLEPGDVFFERRESTSPLALAKRILQCKYHSLGRGTVDGIEVEGFQTTDPNWMVGEKTVNVPEVDFKIWVDVKTRLPVRCEWTRAYFDKTGDKIIQREHFVMHDFQWDVPVDADEFEAPPVPDGYMSLAVKYPAHITEETNIEGLKRLVELLGKYPEKITDIDETLLELAEKSETPAAMRLKEETKGLTEEEIKGIKLVDFLTPIRGLARFANVLQWDKKDSAYYGKTVTPKDADKVLMRWKISDNEYRVIYGDLHAETVTSEKLAELEAALPK